jgi:hypothetical protein
MLGSLCDADNAVQQAWLHLDRPPQRHRQPRRLADHHRRPGEPGPACPHPPAASSPWACTCPTRSSAPTTGSTPSGRRCWPGDRLGAAGSAGHAGARRAAGVGAARQLRGALRPDRGGPGAHSGDAAAGQPGPPPGAGAAVVPDADLARQRAVVEAFPAAARGDFDGLLAVLHPDAVAAPTLAPCRRAFPPRSAAPGWWSCVTKRLSMGADSPGCCPSPTCETQER